MIVLAKFEKQFFVNLLRAVKLHQTQWVTEEGIMYTNESDARRVCERKRKTASFNNEDISYMRYIRVDYVNFPFTSNYEKNLDTIYDLFSKSEEAERARMRDAAKRVKPSIKLSDEEIIKELEQMDKVTGEARDLQEVENIMLEDTAYSWEEVKEALLATVRPKLHHASKYEKVSENVSQLNEDELAELINYLEK